MAASTSGEVAPPARPASCKSCLDCAISCLPPAAPTLPSFNLPPLLSGAHHSSSWEQAVSAKYPDTGALHRAAHQPVETVTATGLSQQLGRTAAFDLSPGPTSSPSLSFAGHFLSSRQGFTVRFEGSSAKLLP